MGNRKIKVLFVCIHNSARSQMAEAFLEVIGHDKFEVESAGLEPGKLNPFAVSAMREVNIDISTKTTDSVFEFFKQEKKYDYVITVCDQASEKKCPIFPGITKRLHWSFDDPSSFHGTYEEKLEKTREIRDKIKTEIENFIKETEKGV